MKTKYSQLLKVKKQKLDALENKLAILNMQKEALKSEVEDILNQIKGLNTPKKGAFREFISSNYAFGTLLIIKKEKEQELYQKNQEIIKIKEEYRLALIDYEKIKYLDNLIIEKKLEKIKKDEQKMLDEISVMTYKRRYF